MGVSLTLLPCQIFPSLPYPTPALSLPTYLPIFGTPFLIPVFLCFSAFLPIHLTPFPGSCYLSTYPAYSTTYLYFFGTPLPIFPAYLPKPLWHFLVSFHPPFFLPSHLPILTCQPPYQPTYLPTLLHTNFPTVHNISYSPFNLHTHLFSYLTQLWYPLFPVFLTYLPIYQQNHSPTFSYPNPPFPRQLQYTSYLLQRRLKQGTQSR